MAKQHIHTVKTRKDNPKLKQPHQTLQYTKWQLSEYIKCKQSLKYFANNYSYIVTLDGGLSKCTLWDFQEDIMDAFQFERFVLINASRQVGKSQLYSLFICWYIIFHDHKKVVILANKLKTVSAILNEKVKLAYENLPLWLQQGVSTWNVNSFDLDNGSSVEICATTPDSVRGITANILIIDEAAVIRDKLWDEFAKSSFPIISSGKTSKIFIVSTPKGYNHFHDLINDSKLGKNAFVNFEVMWNQVPNRDEKFKKNEISLHGEEYFRQEYCCEFLGSSNTLISGAYLKDVLNNIQENSNLIIPIVQNSMFNMLEKYHRNIRVFKLPIENHIYTISHDSATNTDDDSGDSASIQILDITNLPFEQVACADFIDDTSYLEIPYVEVELAKIYNNAIIFNENNDGAGREAGYVITNEICYDHVFWENNKIPGYRTTTSSKSKGCINLKNIVEHGYLKLYDKTTIHQLFQFGKSKNSYKAINGYDDNVLSLLGTIFFLQLDQIQLDDLFGDRYYRLPPIIELMKIIFTTRNESIKDDVTINDNVVEFRNNRLLNSKGDVSLNGLIENMNYDPETVRRIIDRKRSIASIVKGHSENNDYETELFLFGIKDDNNSDKDVSKRTIDDFIF